MEPTRRSSSKKAWWIMACCIVLIVAVIMSVDLFLRDIFQYNTGVITDISVRKNGRDALELNLTYFLPSGGYSVRQVPLDEGQYTGDGMGDYDGSLGRYRVMVDFGDVEPHQSFVKKMDEDGIFELKNAGVPLKATFAHPSDHGFVLYIGSDTPIHVENSGSGEWNSLGNSFGGTIRIPIALEIE